MRRLPAFAMLALFLSLPVVQLKCAISCAEVVGTRGAQTCHHHRGADGPILSALERCDRDVDVTVSPATTTSRAVLVGPVFDVEHVPALLALISTAVQRFPDARPPGRLPGASRLPLRI